MAQMKALIGAGALAAVVIGSFAAASTLSHRGGDSPSRFERVYDSRYDNRNENRYNERSGDPYGGRYQDETSAMDTRREGTMSSGEGLDGWSDYNSAARYQSNQPYGPEYNPSRSGYGERNAYVNHDAYGNYTEGSEGPESSRYGSYEKGFGNESFERGGWGGYGEREEHESEEHEMREREGRRGYYRGF